MRTSDSVSGSHNFGEIHIANFKIWLEKWNLVQMLGGKCSQCYEADLRVLCFHHKSGGIESDVWRHMSRKRRYKDIGERIKPGKDEIRVLCMNCHTKLHSPYPSSEQQTLFRRLSRTRKIGKRVLKDPLDGIMVLDWIFS